MCPITNRGARRPYSLAVRSWLEYNRVIAIFSGIGHDSERITPVIKARPYVSPTFYTRQDASSGFGIAKALGENALLAFPPEAFEVDVVVRRFFGRHRSFSIGPKASTTFSLRTPTITAAPRLPYAYCVRYSAKDCCSAKVRTGNTSAEPSLRPALRARCRCWRATWLRPLRLLSTN